MKKAFTLIVSIAVLSLLAGCVKQLAEQETFPVRLNADRIFAGFADNGTKTYLDQNRKLFWNAEDSLSVFTSNINRKFVFDGKTGDKEGSFTEAFDSEIGSPISGIAAVYPYRKGNSISEDNAKLFVTLPTEQFYTPGSFDPAASIHYAYNSDGKGKNLSFNNLCGYLSIPVYGCGAVQSITLEADVPLSGTMSITIGGENPSLEWAGISSRNSILMNCQDSVWVGVTEADAKEFIFTLPPVTLENGFTVRVRSTDGSVYSKTTSQSREIRANSFVKMSPWYLDKPDYQPFCYLGTNTPAIFLFRFNPFCDAYPTSLNQPELTTIVRLEYYDNDGVRYGRISGTDGFLWNHKKRPDPSIIDGPITFKWYDSDKEGQDQKIVVDSRQVYSDTNMGIASYYDAGDNYYDGKRFSLNLTYSFPGTTMGTFTSLLEMVTPEDASFVAFKDSKFKEYCISHFDLNGDFKLSYAEAAVVDSINVSGNQINPTEIYSLEGIEHFTSLKYLNCSHCQLDSLDVSSNAELINLYCSYNQIKTLIVNNNPALSSLNCANNQITTLIVNNNPALSLLNCGSNQITTLNVNNCTFLKSLYCQGNKLSSLDISNNTAIQRLWCFSNQLTALDVSKNSLLQEFYCSSNLLTTLDVTNNCKLDYLNCEDNRLSSLDVSQNANLNLFYCSSNQLAALDVSKNTALQALLCNSNQLTALDVSQNTILVDLYCNSNQLTTLDVSQNTKLVNLYCNSNQLTTLDVSQNTALKYLYCNSNRLTTLDVSQSTNLESLYCESNQLTTIDLPKVAAPNYAALRYLYCSSNNFSSIDISGLLNLIRFDCLQDGVLVIYLDAYLKSSRSFFYYNYNKKEGMTTFIVK